MYRDFVLKIVGQLMYREKCRHLIAEAQPVTQRLLRSLSPSCT